MTLKADLRHVTYALSDALDLVGVDDVGHGKRVGIMAHACGLCLGLKDPELAVLFDLGLLHDIGVSSTEVHRRIVSEFAWAGSGPHCEIGWDRLQGFAPFAAMALPIKYHHTPWDVLVGKGVEPSIAWQANLVSLMDRVDALMTMRSDHRPVPGHREAIRKEILERAGTQFAPQLVELFLEASRSDAFWLKLEPHSIQAFVQDMLSQESGLTASMADLRELALIFSQIVDAKSPFTAEHSLGVAGLAQLLARKLGLAEDTCTKLEIAGLLHDVGKLRVPDNILEKPGSLDDRERQIISAHSFETYQILRHIKGFEEITSWAACHHEEPDGSGYPFGLDASTLPIEARLLRLADIFQAMVQDRPYRKGLSLRQTLGFLRGLVQQGRMESAFVDLAASCGDEAMVAARASA
jgi:putative nucleotidyltransferase with HDIG domain